ncbi:ribonuclease E/G [Oceaniglobus ichthyenteri]|uniref:ribonuclease E/G n=1 Tax=Oceaniglobus ichthyenteri TaxID=2136177 RepID=UPI000D36D670|nr:ribonuclease E/G [Oceaniglobus ichthyenteri]
MPKKMLIDATHSEETRVVVVDGNKVEEFDFESESRRQLAGNIYLAKVTRVEPSLQAAFVDYGGNRHGFLAFSEIHPDYYQIPVADREALLAEEAAYAKSQEDEEEKPKRRSRTRSRTKTKAEDTTTDDAVVSTDVADGSDIDGMAVVDLGDDDDDEEGSSPMERVGETPVETPDESDDSDDDNDDDENDDDESSASDKDDEIESVAEEDVTEEISRPRKPRARKYKIQEVIKVRQILLVQVVKEERGNKGAALTTYLSLAGRYCVLMPNTARGGGISRKITNVADRKKLKEIANSIDVPQGAGLIIRTAGSQRTKTEIKRDYEYLQRMWEQIRELTLKSIAPAKIYEEGDLIKRSIRDLYNRDIDEVWVEGVDGYRTAKDFMKMIMPSHAKNVKQYQDQMPLFARHQVESYLSGMFNPTVQLKSGGYIVIGVTEALVAIDVNSGRATKEGSIEQTALNTNLEAAAEVARQLRLRDLAGLIVIDFIDMEERRNNTAVEKLFKDRLKTDRARIQVGRISGFGLMEMSRQRLRPGMIEATTQPCHACHGTGLIRSDDNLALNILRQLEEEGVRKRSKEVLVKVPIGICNFLMNQKREHIANIETRYGLSVRVEADPMLISPDFVVEKFKTATRVVEQIAHVVSVDASHMADTEVEDEVEADVEEIEEAPAAIASPPESSNDDDGAPKKRRRRRRRRKNGNGQNGDNQSGGDEDDNGSDASASQTSDEPKADAPLTASDESAPEAEEAPKKRTRAPRKRKSASDEAAKPEATPEAETPEAEGDKPAPRRRRRTRTPDPVVEETAETVVAPVQDAQEPVEPAVEETPEPIAPVVENVQEPVAPTMDNAPEPAAATAETPVMDAPVAETPPAAEPAAEAPAPVDAVIEQAPAAAPDPKPQPALTAQEPALAEETTTAEPAKPKRRGWWSKG